MLVSDITVMWASVKRPTFGYFRQGFDEVPICVFRRSWQHLHRLLYFDSTESQPKLAEKTQPAVTLASLSAKGFRFAIVASRWNDAIVSRLIEGALKALKNASVADDAIELFRVPGAFEIALCAQKAAASGTFDAVICLGVVIR